MKAAVAASGLIFQINRCYNNGLAAHWRAGGIVYFAVGVIRDQKYRLYWGVQGLMGEFTRTRLSL